MKFRKGFAKFVKSKDKMIYQRRRSLRKKLPTKSKNQNIWVGDSETWRHANNPAFWYFRNLENTKDKFYDIKDKEKLLVWLFRGERKVVYFHNLDFDLATLFDVRTISHGNKLVVGSKLIQFKYGSTTFKDSMCLLVNSVSKIGDGLKLPKGETPQKFIDGDSSNGYNDLDVEYCKRDVEIVRVALNLIYEEFKLLVNDKNVSLPLTAASMAYQIYSSKFWPFEYDTIYMQMETFESALNSYYGGRVQNFAESGKFYENVNVYDINSLYPSVMVDNNYPNPKKMWKCENPSVELLDAYIRESKCVWGKFILKTENGLLFLPNKNDEGRRDYTSKEFDGYLCGPELIFALSNGWEIVEILELYAACPIKPFDGYVNYFYNKRLECQKTENPKEFYYKILLNSLYGKFGQRDICKRIENPERVKILMDSKDWEEKYEIKYYSPTVWYLQEKNASLKSKNTWAGWSAFATSYARVQLAESIRDNKNVLYCDTDSIHVSLKPNETNLIMGNNLGEWKLEAKDIPLAQYWEPKVYRFCHKNKTNIKVKHKGCNLSTGDLKQLQYSRQLVKYRSALRRESLEMGEFIMVEKRSKKYYRGP